MYNTLLSIILYTLQVMKVCNIETKKYVKFIIYFLTAFFYHMTHIKPGDICNLIYLKVRWLLHWLLLLYKSFILPHINNALMEWGYKNKKIFNLQKIVTGSTYLAHTDTLFF